MRILLLQEERYLPTFGGGHKANRRLLEELARRGHACLAVCPAHNRDTPEDEFLAALAGRGVEVRRASPRLFQYAFRGVEVDGLATGDLERRAAWIRDRIESWRPDLVLVSDDGRFYLLDAALNAMPDRVVFLVHNQRHLPFGPLAVRQDPEQAARLGQVRAILVMSRYSREYLQEHGGLRATPVRLPVDVAAGTVADVPAGAAVEAGAGTPFEIPGGARSGRAAAGRLGSQDGSPPYLGEYDSRFITLVKPTVGKGVGLFLALADRFPRVDFAAVPTWGNTPDAAVLAALQQRSNVHLLPPADDLDGVLAQTRVLLVPSLVPETFGLVVPEAMARGVPVLASDAGGLPEAKLGVDFLLPVRQMTGGEAPPQDVEPWATTLGLLLSNRDAWERCSRESRQAGLAHLARTGVESCESLLGEIAEVAAGALRPARTGAA